MTFLVLSFMRVIDVFCKGRLEKALAKACDIGSRKLIKVFDSGMQSEF